LGDDPESIDWTAEPEKLADAVLPFYEVTAATAARQALTPAIAADWGAVNQAVLKLAKTRAARFGEMATATSQDRTAAIIADWVEQGGTMPDLIRSVKDVWGGPRADLAAITEVTDLYAQGNATTWQTSGVVSGMTWNTANDDVVCRVCGPLDGSELAFDDDMPPAHPGCRCWVTPIVGRGDDDA
jgi:SPP1 gp7 family putative phage head morphogenesis protein